MAVGKYDDAEGAARRATTAAKGAQLWNTLGEVLVTRARTRRPSRRSCVHESRTPPTA